MKTLWRTIAMLVLLVGAPTFLCGCPQVMAKVLPIVTDILTEILDAERKIDMVDNAAQAWFAQHPDAKTQHEWQKAVDVTKASLDVALKLAHGAKDLAESDHEAAFQQFALAWQTLLEMASQIGVMSQTGQLNAGTAIGVKVDTPLALQPRGSSR